MGLDKDRETIKQLQDVVLHMANLVSALNEQVAELKEDHIKLRNQFMLSATLGLSPIDPT